MKYILTILLCLPFIVKSQDTIKLPTPVARQITTDLTKCDSVKVVHELTVKQLTLTENKSVLQDSIIKFYRQKCKMYDVMLTNSEKKFQVQKAWSEDLRKENKGLKARLLYTKITMGVSTLFFGYLLLHK